MKTTYERVRLALEKSQVKAHTRTLKSGKVVSVKGYSDTRSKKQKPVSRIGGVKVPDGTPARFAKTPRPVKSPVFTEKQIIDRLENGVDGISNMGSAIESTLSDIYSDMGWGLKSASGNKGRTGEFEKRDAKYRKTYQEIDDELMRIFGGSEPDNTLNGTLKTYKEVASLLDKAERLKKRATSVRKNYYKN